MVLHKGYSRTSCSLGLLCLVCSISSSFLFKAVRRVLTRPLVPFDVLPVAVTGIRSMCCSSALYYASSSQVVALSLWTTSLGGSPCSTLRPRFWSNCGFMSSTSHVSALTVMLQPSLSSIQLISLRIPSLPVCGTLPSCRVQDMLHPERI